MLSDRSTPEQTGGTILEMWQKLKNNWRELRKAKPGTRFKERYRSRQQSDRSLMAKPLCMAAGILVFLLGVAMLPAPGPGLLIMIIGAALIAEESYAAAVALDSFEVRLRRVLGWLGRLWQRTTLAIKAALVALAASVAGGAGWGAWQLFF